MTRSVAEFRSRPTTRHRAAPRRVPPGGGERRAGGVSPPVAQIRGQARTAARRLRPRATHRPARARTKPARAVVRDEADPVLASAGSGAAAASACAGAGAGFGATEAAVAGFGPRLGGVVSGPAARVGGGGAATAAWD